MLKYPLASLDSEALACTVSNQLSGTIFHNIWAGGFHAVLRRESPDTERLHTDTPGSPSIPGDLKQV